MSEKIRHNVHIYPSPCTRESRMFRLTKALADGDFFKSIILVGIDEPGLPMEEDLDLRRRIMRVHRSCIYKRSLLFGRIMATFSWSFAVWHHLKGMEIACINAHSLPVLPLCVALKWRHKAKLVYDTHELETETIISRGLRKTLSKLTESIFIRFTDHIFCVGDKIADWYQAHYRILRPTVIRNIPDMPTEPAKVRSLRLIFDVPENAVLFAYVGLIARGRGIDELLEIFVNAAPDRHVVIIGAGPQEDRVIQASKQYANIHHLPAVPHHEVVPYLSSADVGISMDVKGCLSYLYSLPNKFFEYIHANIPVLVGGMPEQLDIVKRYDIGWILPYETASATHAINTLSRADIAAKKANISPICTQLNWAIEEKTLLGAYRTLMAMEDAD